MMYTENEIKVAAMDVMMANPGMAITGMSFLKALLEQLKEADLIPEIRAVPEPAPMKEMEETAKDFLDSIDRVTGETAGEAADKQDPQSFRGYGWNLKKETLDALQKARSEGRTINELVKATDGKLTDTDVLYLLDCRPMPFGKWKTMAKALGVRTGAEA